MDGEYRSSRLLSDNLALRNGGEKIPLFNIISFIYFLMKNKLYLNINM